MSMIIGATSTFLIQFVNMNIHTEYRCYVTEAVPVEPVVTYSSCDCLVVAWVIV